MAKMNSSGASPSSPEPPPSCKAITPAKLKVPAKSVTWYSHRVTSSESQNARFRAKPHLLPAIDLPAINTPPQAGIRNADPESDWDQHSKKTDLIPKFNRMQDAPPGCQGSSEVCGRFECSADLP